MDRRGLVSLIAAVVGFGAAGAACGGDGLSDDPLPSMFTTTTSTTLLTTTTEPQMEQYRVQSGDLLGNIARAYGVDIDELMALNGITNPDRIEVGQVLKIPPSTVPVADTLPPP